MLLFSYVCEALTFIIAQALPPRDSNSVDLGWRSGILYFYQVPVRFLCVLLVETITLDSYE